MTPHIGAKKGEIAKLVFMSGDPLRAKHFADNFLTDVKMVSDIRNMFVFTGTYKNKEVTVMGHGMGLDSIGIYAFELYSFYDVETIIRFGSAGAYSEEIDVLDVVIADKAFTESNYGLGFGFEDKIIEATPEILEKTNSVIKSLETSTKIINSTVNSSMWFYQTHNQTPIANFVKDGITAVEMEAYALYAIARSLGKQAIAILTISDHLVKKTELSPEDRATKFGTAFDILLGLIEAN